MRAYAPTESADDSTLGGFAHASTDITAAHGRHRRARGAHAAHRRGARAEEDTRGGAQPGPGHPRSDAGAHVRRPHRVRALLREALRDRRGTAHLAAARRRAARHHRRRPTVTIKLRAGVKFNDGTPMDAD